MNIEEEEKTAEVKNKIKRNFPKCKGILDNYRWYKKTTGSRIKYDVFKDIIYTFNKEVCRLIIEESFDFKMPYRLGNLYIIQFKNSPELTADFQLNKKKLRIDWGTTIKLWKDKHKDKTHKEIIKMIKDAPKDKKGIVYHFNEHTNYNVCKWFWDKRFTKVINVKLYTFKIAKVNRLLLAKHIKSSNKKNTYFNK